MQAASDIFLGWTKGVQDNRYFYWRQLRDMKGSAVVEGMTPGGARGSTRASVAARWRARTHAPGDPVALAAYLGKKDRFDESITDFSERYADQNERDYQAFTDAIRSGRLPVARRCLTFTQAARKGRDGQSLKTSRISSSTCGPRSAVR